jgi:hypothetical protein
MSATDRAATTVAELDAEDHPDLPKADHLPDFTSEEELRAFWDSHDVSAVWDLMEDVTHNPPPGLRMRPEGEPSRARKRPPEGRMDLVSIRLPAEMIDGVKAIAARRHLPYQTLMRSWIGERLAQEQASLAAEQDGIAPGT